MKTQIYQGIAKNCQWLKTVNDSFLSECESRIDKLEHALPSGSGIDCGCKIDRSNSGKDKIVITFDYHFMNEDGYYDGWGKFRLVLKPVFGYDVSPFDMKITGKNRNDVKDYFYDLFDHALKQCIDV